MGFGFDICLWLVLSIYFDCDLCAAARFTLNLQTRVQRFRPLAHIEHSEMPHRMGLIGHEPASIVADLQVDVLDAVLQVNLNV